MFLHLPSAHPTTHPYLRNQSLISPPPWNLTLSQLNVRKGWAWEGVVMLGEESKNGENECEVFRAKGGMKK